MNELHHASREVSRHDRGLWWINECACCALSPFQLWVSQGGQAVLLSFHSTVAMAQIAADAYEEQERWRAQRWLSRSSSR